MARDDLTYSAAGVDIDTGNELVRRIKNLKGASRPEILSGIGGFAGAFSVPAGYRDPVFLSSTDGVGTKLKVAFMANRHDTVGQDLVAMSVNDVLAMGGEPVVFLDYFATGRLDADTAHAVIKGISDACTLAGCTLLGGETAELPGFYADGEYDLAGFCVAVAERSSLPEPDRVSPGDVVIGLPSSGLHSNGYSLARRVIFDVLGLGIDDPFPGEPDGRTVADVLLEPTVIYVKDVLPLIKEGLVRAMVHVTGGGLVDNPPRVLPAGLGMDLDRSSWKEPNVFRVLREAGVSDAEMARTFNLGLGYLVVVPQENSDRALDMLRSSGSDARVVGRITQRDGSSRESRLV